MKHWTEEEDKRLRTLHKYYTYSQLAGMMGVTKNAAIGRARRMGLIGDRVNKKEVFYKEGEPLMIPIEELRPESCRFPFGEGRKIKFCGIKRKGPSYCSAHHNLTHRQSRPKK
tara:strand:- start:521 stop:859 length:339 start_codon:yes stop_codon:yes gene_type:complete